MDPLILGIDAGGSKTVAWLARWNEAAGPQVIGRGAAGPANPQSVGFDESLKSLTAAVAAAFAAGDIPRQAVASAVLAAAGSDREENRRAFCAWAEETSLAVRFQVVHDAWPVLAAGTPDGWGIALISGTGSLAFGRARDGRTARAGGWGFLFGDEGSGYALAVAGLRAAAQAADGRAVPTRLLDALLGRLHLDRPEALIPAVYAMAGNRQRIAELAKTVLDVAAAGDAIATGIIADAARQLALMVAAVAARLGWAAGSECANLPSPIGRGAGGEGSSATRIPLALAGGVLVGSPSLCERLQEELRALGVQAAPIGIVPEPVLGSLRLAGEATASHARSHLSLNHTRGPQTNASPATQA